MSYLLTIKYRDRQEDTEIVADKHSVLHVASKLDDTHVESATVEDPDGNVIWNTQLHITAGDMSHVVNNLTYYKAEALAENSPNEVAIYHDGENEFVLSNRTGLDYGRWELRGDDENDGLISTFYARDVDHARRLAANYTADGVLSLLDEEGEVFEL